MPAQACPDCGRVFTKPAHLLRHRTSHAQQKPFACTSCDKAFARVDALQRHERTVHSSSSSNKRRRTDDSADDDDDHDDDEPPSDGMPEPTVHTPPSACAPSDLVVMSPCTAFLDTTPYSNLPSFLTAATTIPASDIDDVIAEWLNHDGGALTTENALAAVFSDQALMELPSLQMPLAASSSHQPTVHRRTITTQDAWGAGRLPQSDYPVSRPESPQPTHTTPDQFAAELHFHMNGVTTTSQETDIPSLKFLDACLHLYFREFHPSFPVIHRATFQRDRTSPLLLLSMCSIGCMFVGTQAAKSTGLWIYERLINVAVVTRETRMVKENTRIAVILASLLGQCFSFLYGHPRHMYSAESFHSSVISMGRACGLAGKIKRNPVTYDQVANLDAAGVHRQWREWGRQETLRRAMLGLTLHAAEATSYSRLPHMLPTQITAEDTFSDALFEADDTETWLRLLRGDGVSSTAPDVFLPMARLAQCIVNIHSIRGLAKTPLGIERPLPEFYDFMATQTGATQEIAALWHYACTVRLAPITLIEEAAGRTGNPDAEIVLEIQAWVQSPTARLAMLHCGNVLHRAAQLKDLGFLLPRAIFHATLLLFCYLSFVSEDGLAVDALDVADWRRLGELCEGAERGGDVALAYAESLQSLHQQYVVSGVGCLRVSGLLDGSEKMLNMVSLRSTTNRLLRKCTHWGIGDTLGDILADVVF